MSGNELILSMADGLFTAIQTGNWLMILVYALAFLSFLAILFGVLVIIIKIFRKILLIIERILRSPKKRASQIKCSHCGRTLANCVCASNRNAGYMKRIRKHKKELKNKKGR